MDVKAECDAAKSLGRSRRFAIADCTLAVACLASVVILDTNAAAPVELVTRGDSTVPSSSGSSDSSAPVVSGDGRFVVFLSSAQNLTTNTSSGTVNVFLRDRQLGQTTLVSAGTNGAAANAACSSPGISSNGLLVVFQSRASNLVSGATNGWENIFVRDLAAGTTTLVSANTNGLGGRYSSLNPQMTPGGRFVVFESIADDLAENDTNNLPDVFIRDMTNTTAILASVSASGTGSGSGYSINPSITPDGRFVVFESTARNLVTNDLNTTSDIFLRDLTVGTTTLISVNAAGSAAGNSRNPVCSDDGRRVAFESRATNLALGDFDSQNDIFVYYVESGTVRLGSTYIGEFHGLTNTPSRPVISRDGSIVAFQVESGLSNASTTLSQIYVWYTNSDSNRLVSGAFDGTTPANGASHSPIISADNRCLTFLSNATNLITTATSGQFQVYQRDLTLWVTELVSFNSAGTGNNLDCSGPAASDDGRLVAFDSLDGYLVPDDFNDAYDVFVRDLAANSTELVSQAVTNLRSATARGLSSVVPGCVNANGRYVVFATLADRLAPNDTNRAYDVFVRDLWNGTNALVSIGTNGAPANGSSPDAVVSADGRFVAFLSNATDLTSGVTNRVNNVYLRDLQQATTILVTVNTNSVGSAGSASSPAISGDGRFVVFESVARDLSQADANTFQDLFVFDRSTGSNTLVSARTTGSSGNGASRSPRITPNGRTVIFLSDASNLVTNTVPSPSQVFARDLVDQATMWVSQTGSGSGSFGLGGQVVSIDSRFITYARSNLFLYDSAAGTNLTIPTRAGNPCVSADGRFIAFEKPVLSGNSVVSLDIMVFDTQLGIERLASVNLAGTAGGNGRSRSPVISADGRFAVFKSQASDLVPNDNNGVSDIFVRDLVLGQTLLISLNRSGTGSGDLLSADPVMGADGRTVLFESFASDLVAGDFNQTRDVFVLRLGGEDTDQDGMDDDWEVTYFNDLTRDGTGDFDDDGATDLEEFKSGTNPSNDTSVLRALTVTTLSTGNVTVHWSAVAGRTYQVQFKNRIDSAWTDLPGEVTATESTANKLDDTAAGNPTRFYRVVLATP